MHFTIGTSYYYYVRSKVYFFFIYFFFTSLRPSPAAQGSALFACKNNQAKKHFER